MEAVLCPTPTECQQKISDASWSSFQEISNYLDETCIAYGFRVSKMNGSKNYLYYQCHMGGGERSRNNNQEKERDKLSKKTGIFIHFKFNMM